MRVLLHTPLKAPDSPVPSGDREMARGLARFVAFLGAGKLDATAIGEPLLRKRAESP